MITEIAKAAQIIGSLKSLTVFTGAGISAESGIPVFRGEGGLWQQYNPEILDINYFLSHPLVSWTAIKKLFYDFLKGAKPNAAHFALAELEMMGIKTTIITQNIDNFHQMAGSSNVIEFHGTTKNLICTKCHRMVVATETILSDLPPRCEQCHSLLKPDFVFFGEGIPHQAYTASLEAATHCDAMLVIGTSGEVMPANLIPIEAKRHGAIVIEINSDKNVFATGKNDIFICAKAGEVLLQIVELIKTEKS
jgi:NAD-dependent deacetylase